MKHKRPYKKSKKRVGRGIGSGHGKTACRGYKGQRSRTGSSLSPGFEGGQMPLIRRVPKRGFNNNKFKKAVEIVNIAVLNSLTESTVTPDTLIERGIIRKNFDGVKILGSGSLRVAKTVHAHAFSRRAQEAIEQSGGKAILLTHKKA